MPTCPLLRTYAPPDWRKIKEAQPGHPSGRYYRSLNTKTTTHKQFAPRGGHLHQHLVIIVHPVMCIKILSHPPFLFYKIHV